MKDPTAEENARADKLAKIFWDRLRIKKNEIVCPFEKSEMTPCITRDGSMCLIRVLDRGKVRAVRLTDDEVALLKMWGGGSLTEGIRGLVQKAAAWG